MADHGQTAVKKRRSLPVSFHYTLMMIPGFVWLILFSIVPMVGIVMAFQNFNPGKGIFGSEWVGLDNFIYLTRMGDVPRIIRNTLVTVSYTHLDVYKRQALNRSKPGLQRPSAILSKTAVSKKSERAGTAVLWQDSKPRE